MKILIEISSEDAFDTDDFMSWLNSELNRENVRTGSDFYASYFREINNESN